MNTRAGKTSNESSTLDEKIEEDSSLRTSGVQARAQRHVSSDQMRAQRPASAGSLLISIGAPADLALLEPTYAYVSAYCFACLSGVVAQRLAVAVYELYSNALRYATPASEVRLELHQRPEGVLLSVANDAAAAHAEHLASHLARVQADSKAAFRSEMDRFAGASHPPAMLGIVRLAFETKLELELRVDAGRVQISTLVPAHDAATAL